MKQPIWCAASVAAPMLAAFGGAAAAEAPPVIAKEQIIKNANPCFNFKPSDGCLREPLMEKSTRYA